MPLRLIYSAETAGDLEAIYRHIAPDSPAAADRFVRGIEARCEALCETPQLGVARPDLREGVRVFSFRRRVAIAYRIEDEAVLILRVFYGGQDYEAIMGGD